MRTRTLALLAALLPATAFAATVPTPQFAPKVGTRLDATLAFRDEAGKVSTLDALIGGRPTLILFGYDRCPGLCGVAQLDLAQALGKTGLDPARYRVLFASIDPHEGPDDASDARAKLAEALPDSALSGWHFITGDERTVASLDAAAGLTVSALPGRDLYVHPVATLVVTGDGRISRAFGGLDYVARDLRLAIVEASQGRLGTIVDRLTVLCSSFDPSTGRYSSAIMVGLRIAGVATLALLGVGVLALRRRETSR